MFLGFGGLGLFRAEGSVIQGLGLGGLGFKVVIATSSRLEKQLSSMNNRKKRKMNSSSNKGDSCSSINMMTGGGY